MAHKDNSKQWFRTDSFPSDVNFAQVFDWLRWKDEQISIADIEELTDVLNSFVLKTAVVDLTSQLQAAQNDITALKDTVEKLKDCCKCTPQYEYSYYYSGEGIGVDNLDLPPII